MATKYAGQNALNKLMQLVKTALNNKADKTNATTSAAGLMSAADKVKLDGVEAGANKTTVDDTMSGTSKNPVQNKVIKQYVDDHAADGAVLYTAQTLTYDQKFQARKNIGAVGNDSPQFQGYVALAPANETLGSGVGLSPTGSGHNYTLDISDVDEGNPTLLTGVKTPTDADTNAAATVEYVKAKVASGGVTVDTAMSATSTNPVQNKIVKNYVDNKVSGLQTASQVQDAIKSAITGVYTPKGSTAFASLPTAAAGNKGWVYNVSDSFTTTAAFVEGAGHSYGAGTNVVCVDAGSGSYKWDVLAGTVDLTELTADEVQTLWNSI